MALRVIAGKARGMKLKAVPGDSTRPVMDRVKEALFSIIGAEIHGANFLDLFAGTGSVGIEALSRGAGFAQFVDVNARALKTIRANLAHTRLGDSAQVIRRDAFQLLAKPPDRLYHFVYVAPPQYRGLWQKTLLEIDDNEAWHHKECQVIVQIDPQEYAREQTLRRLQAVDKRKYGRTMLVFYRFTKASNSESLAADPPG